ncbi:MAG: hypothetical protein WAU86_16165 [Oricola sp.]
MINTGLLSRFYDGVQVEPAWNHSWSLAPDGLCADGFMPSAKSSTAILARKNKDFLKVQREKPLSAGIFRQTRNIFLREPLFRQMT